MFAEHFLGSTKIPNCVREANVRPIKNGLKSPGPPRYTVGSSDKSTILCILCSASDTLSLQISRTSLSTVGARAFSVFFPSAWNDLPLPLRRKPSLDSVKPKNIYFPETIDAPCFPFCTAVFIHRMSCLCLRPVLRCVN